MSTADSGARSATCPEAVLAPWLNVVRMALSSICEERSAVGLDVPPHLESEVAVRWARVETIAPTGGRLRRTFGGRGGRGARRLRVPGSASKGGNEEQSEPCDGG